jgi:hypothetical protein
VSGILLGTCHFFVSLLSKQFFSSNDMNYFGLLALDLPATGVGTRVARWFLFRPKIPIWIYFGGPWNGKCCYIVWSYIHILFYNHWVYFMGFG